jgi:transposase
MAGVFWLSDKAWAAIDPLLPKIYAGARRQDDRRIISGIIHVLRSGCRWQDCPSVYGPSTTVYNRFNRWSGRGRWMAILEALRETIPNDMRSIDSSSIKVQRAGAGGKGGHKRRRSAVRVAGGRPRSTPSPTAKGGYSAST